MKCVESVPLNLQAEALVQVPWNQWEVFSLISVGAGSCPNRAKQPPTLQNKYREAYGYCQGNRWILIWFVKELETACCVLIRRLSQATGIV